MFVIVQTLFHGGVCSQCSLFTFTHLLTYLLTFTLLKGDGCTVWTEDSPETGKILSTEKKLIKDLLDRYAKYGIVGRPVRNTYDTITVDFGLALVQILDLDEKNQILNTNVWSRYVRKLFVDPLWAH